MIHRHVCADHFEDMSEDVVVKDYLTTAADGKGYRVKYYNLVKQLRSKPEG